MESHVEIDKAMHDISFVTDLVFTRVDFKSYYTGFFFSSSVCYV